MIPSRDQVLRKLPPDRNTWVKVVEEQTTDNIIEGMLHYQRQFEPYYDRIGTMFCGSDTNQTADNLFHFCKRYIRYSAEDDKWQSTAVPQGVLNRGYGDCKAYASFVGGCLGAINRSGVQSIPWEYCFASYGLLELTMYHVFIICKNEQGQEIWIDPTPGSDKQTPVWWIKVPM
jgi:hypothetical protein